MYENKAKPRVWGYLFYFENGFKENSRFYNELHVFAETVEITNVFLFSVDVVTGHIEYHISRLIHTKRWWTLDWIWTSNCIKQR